MLEKSFDVKISDGRKIKCKSFTLREYLENLLARTNPSSDLMKKSYNEILEKNATTNLSKHDAELVLINLMAKSEYEDGIFLDYICDCGNEFKVEIDPSKIKVNFNDVDINELYPLKKFKLKLKWPSLWDDDNVPKMISKCIDSVFVGQEQIKIEDLNELEIIDLYEAISSEDITKIKNILTSPKLYSLVSVKCEKCGKSHIHIINGFKEFVELL